MKIPAKSQTDFEVVPAGNHLAICNAVVDLGMQPGSGMYPDPKPQLYLRFELPAKQITYQKDGKDLTGPMSIGRSLTASMSEKANLRKIIESWQGAAFPSDDAASNYELRDLLGKTCLVNVAHTKKKDKTYANIVTVTPLPDGMEVKVPQHNESLYYSLEEPDAKAFAKLPKWLQEKIAKRIKPGEEAPIPPPSDREAPVFDDDIPF